MSAKTFADPTFADRVQRWYAEAARDLPWRSSDATPWAVLVSEFMLQQTQVSRVLPVWRTWLERWPDPSALAAESPGEAVRAWGRLGYPRRALRLHATAVAITERHGGVVPETREELRALPGVGDYTAAAIAAFAFGVRAEVLDTNVRRVYARVFDGAADAAGSPTVGKRREALERVPDGHPGRYGVAVMELGALVCTARSPECPACPVAASCGWLAAGRPPAATRGPRQRYAGTDRQVRGALLAVLRDSTDPVPRDLLDVVWPDSLQRGRALDGLVADGLVEPLPDDRFRLPA
jgi:A/G-specific adenine glycosylase